MSNQQQAVWLLRVGIAVVLLLGAIYWFPDHSIHGMGVRIAYWALLALPWLVALFMPATRVEFAVAVLAGASWAVVPQLVFLAVLAPLSDLSSALAWFLAIAMTGTAVIGIVAAIMNLRERNVDVWILLIVGACAFLYEPMVLGEIFR